MKRILGVLIVILISFNLVVLADTIPTVEITGPMELKKGEKATITVNIKDVDRLYGIQMDYRFNTNDIKVLSLKKGNMLADAPYGSMDSSGNTIVEGKPVKYYLTFIGENDGVSGSGEVIYMEIEALKDCKLTFNTKNTDIILVNIGKKYEISNMKFKFVGTEEPEIVDPSKPNTEEGSSGSSPDSNNSSVNNSEDPKDKPVSNDDENSSDINAEDSNSNTLVGSKEEFEGKKESGNLAILSIVSIVILSGVGGFIYLKRKR